MALSVSLRTNVRKFRNSLTQNAPVQYTRYIAKSAGAARPATGAPRRTPCSHPCSKNSSLFPTPIPSSRTCFTPKSGSFACRRAPSPGTRSPTLITATSKRPTCRPKCAPPVGSGGACAPGWNTARRPTAPSACARRYSTTSPSRSSSTSPTSSPRNCAITR